ncbi:MAG: hypothetical protein QW641_02090 [Candidatus Aenigmatarchaeota archaeon]
MKCISPLIATLLLISFTVAVSVIIFNWGIPFFRKMASDVGNKTSTELECKNGAVVLENLRFCNDWLYMEIRNRGNIDLTGLALAIFYTNNSQFQYPLCFAGNKVVVCSNDEYNLTLRVNVVYVFNITANSNIDFLYLKTSCPNVYDRVSSTLIEFC